MTSTAGATTTVGTCGNCGGPVRVPYVWYATIPPTPTCAYCGATAKQDFGPALPMNPPVRVQIKGNSDD